MERLVAAAFPFLMAMACGAGDRPGSPTVVLGREFQLRPGQSTSVPGAGFALKFEKVENDSRCPVDVTCVWEGDAAVVVKLISPPAAEETKELHTSKGEGRPGELERNAFVIRLVKLTPVPRSTATIPPADYRATFVATRK